MDKFQKSVEMILKKDTEDWSEPEEEAAGLVMKSVFLCQFALAVE